MMNSISMADYLSDCAVDALITEVSLTPKPGLVDKLSSNAHRDMDWNLLVLSAKSLRSCFYQIAKRAEGSLIDQSLREDIAEIGRQGELTMLETTHGINTHKGAIWILGLMIAVLSSQKELIRSDTLFSLIGTLASFDDRFYHPTHVTKGQLSKQRFGVRSALDEARAGFPVLQQVLLMKASVTQDHVLYWLEKLIQLISLVDDTCIISRSNLETLRMLQKQAKNILVEGIGTVKGKKAYQQLCEYCLNAYVSPGGSADLLAALIFLKKLGVINGTVEF